MAAKRTLTLIHGDKGGIGKSMTANAVADFLLSKGIGNSLRIVDADQRNPDVARMFPDIAIKIGLLTHDGWNELYDYIAANPDCDFLVNLPAGAGAQIEKEVETLREFCTDQDLKVVMFFPIDRLNDTINLLKAACATIGPLSRRNTVVVKNLFFGDAHKFTKFDESDIRRAIEGLQGRIIEMPELNADVVSAVMGDYHSENAKECVRFSTLLASNPRPSMKFDLAKWQRTMWDQYESIYTTVAATGAKKAKGE